MNRNTLKSVWRAVMTNNEHAVTTTLADRSRYKDTWQHMASSMDAAKTAVAGHTDEAELNQSGLYTVNTLDRFVGINASDACLEIGCGVGRVGKIMSQRCRRWIGTDISAAMLEYASQRLAELDNVELIELGGDGLGEVADCSVDLVYSTVVFMHLYEWDRYKYVQEAMRVLRPGGHCYFDNVDIASDHGWKVFMNGFSFEPDKRPAHLSMISTGEELETYALKAGFTQVQVHRWDDAWVGVTGRKS